MGIPKLSTDLYPYLEDIVLGSSSTAKESGLEPRDEITRVVIDGPAFVYFAYHRLLPMAIQNDWQNPYDAQPSYRVITQGVIESLQLLQGKVGVHIERIYFDGGLPLEKTEVRLARLEKARNKLESFCKSFPRDGYKRANRQGIGAGQYSESPASIFKREQLFSGQSSFLPEPPFMVPAVVEELRHHSAFASIVSVVPGEADHHCAALAKRTGVAILSNDSDLLVYDLGHKGTIVLLDSLVLCNGLSNVECRISGSCWKPWNIAGRLGLTSVSRLAYERHRDPSAAFHILKTKAITPLSETQRLEFLHFTKAYTTETENDHRNEDEDVVLDPRVAELFNQFVRCPVGVVPQVYLPMMIENHSRVSSWNNGIQYRLLAYSLLALSRTNNRNLKTIYENLRVGQRIGSQGRNLYRVSESKIALESTIRDLRRSRELFISSTLSESPERWWLFGLYIVCDKLKTSGKGVLDKEWVIRFMAPEYTASPLTLDGLHVQACVQAVLYSLRVLAQLTTAVYQRFSCPIRDLVMELLTELHSLPKLQGMFEPGTTDLSKGWSSESMQNIISNIYSWLDAEDGREETDG